MRQTQSKSARVPGGRPFSDLGRQLARRLGVPISITGVGSMPEVIDNVKPGSADIDSLTLDPMCTVEVDSSPGYSLDGKNMATNVEVIENGQSNMGSQGRMGTKTSPSYPGSRGSQGNMGSSSSGFHGGRTGQEQ